MSYNLVNCDFSRNEIKVVNDLYVAEEGLKKFYEDFEMSQCRKHYLIAVKKKKF